MDMPAASFTNYFLASSSSSTSTSTKHWTARQGVLELCHNYGSEADPSFAVANGNEATKAAGRGFGHICISVDNLRAACARLDRSGLGRGWQKRVEEGKMREIAFAKDPDGYWVELVGQGAAGGEEQEGTDPGTYLVNHSMIRVKDPQRSLRFYRDVLGMQLVRTIKAEGFDLLFLGYHAPTEDSAKLEGLLELTWNHGTEKQEGPDEIYASGNQEPRGFGHVAVTVDDLEAACQRLEEKGVRWQKKLREGRMKMVAFVLDPDGYWVEILQNEDLKRDVN